MTASTLLQGKVVIISGVGVGFGRDLALAMVENGAQVVLGARRAATLQSVLSLLYYASLVLGGNRRHE